MANITALICMYNCNISIYQFVKKNINTMIVLYTMYILIILKYKSMQIKTVLPQN